MQELDAACDVNLMLSSARFATISAMCAAKNMRRKAADRVSRKPKIRKDGPYFSFAGWKLRDLMVAKGYDPAQGGIRDFALAVEKSLGGIRVSEGAVRGWIRTTSTPNADFFGGMQAVLQADEGQFRDWQYKVMEVLPSGRARCVRREKAKAPR